MAKSFISSLIGFALDEGAIEGVDVVVSDTLPELVGSGYEGVTLKNVLQMSSGIHFNEDYGDFGSDINRMGRALALGTSLTEFVASLENEKPPGTWNHYVSMDTQVLGMMLTKSTGQTISAYMEDRLWKPLGAEQDAYWLLDAAGMEWAFGGLNMTIRDFGRYGQLFLQEGVWEGRQLLPAGWVHESTMPDGPHVQPEHTESGMGYGYQWWIPPNSDGEYMALGIYGQNIYVDPKHRLVIVKTSADPRYQDNQFESTRIGIAAYRAVADHIAALGAVSLAP